MKRLTLLVCLLGTVFTASAKLAFVEKLFSRFFPNESTYVMAFTKTGNPNSVQFLYSQDGLRWNSAERQVEIRGISDFTMIQDQDSLFHLVWANGAHSLSLLHATSKDLIQWSDAAELPVMKQETDARYCLYPTLNQQGNTYSLMWTSSKIASSNNSNTANQLYISNTSNFTGFTKPLMCLESASPKSQPVLFNVKRKTFLFFIKEDVENGVSSIEMSRVKSLKKLTFNPSKVVVSNKKMETPVVVQINKYTYMYWNDAETGKIKALRTKKLKDNSWEDVTDMIFIPSGIQMGAILKVDDAFFAKIANPNR